MCSPSCCSMHDARAQSSLSGRFRVHCCLQDEVQQALVNQLAGVQALRSENSRLMINTGALLTQTMCGLPTYRGLATGSQTQGSHTTRPPHARPLSTLHPQGPHSCLLVLSVSHARGKRKKMTLGCQTTALLLALHRAPFPVTSFATFVCSALT